MWGEEMTQSLKAHNMSSIIASPEFPSVWRRNKMNMPEELHWTEGLEPKTEHHKNLRGNVCLNKTANHWLFWRCKLLKILVQSIGTIFFLDSDSFYNPHENRPNSMYFELIKPSKKKAAIFPISIQWHTRPVTHTILFSGRFCIREPSCNA